nr:MAG TPA: hypothetical protein [Caudoviricetes sp.]
MSVELTILKVPDNQLGLSRFFIFIFIFFDKILFFCKHMCDLITSRPLPAFGRWVVPPVTNIKSQSQKSKSYGKHSQQQRQLSVESAQPCCLQEGTGHS